MYLTRKYWRSELRKKKAKLKVKRKRNNITRYIRRKLRKQAEHRMEPTTFDTPEKRIRLTEVYECNEEHVLAMDRFEVNINIINVISA